MQRPTQYVLPPKSITRVVILASFFPMVIALVIFAGVYLSDKTALDEWQIPLLGIAGVSLTTFICSSIFATLMSAWERRAIRNVYDNAWADWAQYTKEEKWHKFIESDYQKALKEVSFSIAPIVIVGVVVSIIAVAGYMESGEVLLLFGLGGFMLIVVAVIVLDWWSKKADINARYKRRQKMPSPHTIISRKAHYDEDKGYSTLRGLKAVRYEEGGKTTPAKIIFTVRRPWWEYIIFNRHGYSHVRQWEVVVKVPKGYEDEAQALLERFRTEVLG